MSLQINYSVNNEENPIRRLSDIKAIILHHTGNNNDSQPYLNKSDYISVHYIIKRDGSIWLLMDEDRIAYHAGESSWQGLKTKGGSLNWCTIGIEVESDGYSFLPQQKKSARLLIKDLMARYNVPEKLLLRHKDIAPTRKWDIGDSFWSAEYNSWEEYKLSYKKMDKELSQLLDGSILALENAEYWMKALFNYGKGLFNDEASEIASSLRAFQAKLGNLK